MVTPCRPEHEPTLHPAFMHGPVDETNGQALITAFVQINENLVDAADAETLAKVAKMSLPPCQITRLPTLCMRRCSQCVDVEGLNSIDAFAALNGDSDVTEMAKRMAARTANVGRVILGTMQIKKIQTLVNWVKDHHKCNLDVDPHAWTEMEVIMAAMQRKESDKNFEKIDVDIIDPGKCQVDKGWGA